MHIKDHSAAMKFFRTYDSAASKGKWKEFDNIMLKDNISRKECLLLPIKTTIDALNKKNYESYKEILKKIN